MPLKSYVFFCLFRSPLQVLNVPVVHILAFPGLARCFRFWQSGWSATGSLPQPEAEVSKDTELFNDFPGSN